ncbi:hypothetical protein Hden_3020 [Hyphomicrobium denitrificans ATCC 51888]|uniref:Uncharacterized protein n=1 Tax=Hyphomicrobium denitrificans (strain ATCC 51888 / DSM 1869 / NCIMB 11706 / TK 0415) TaxID=582899 RepID=D8JVG1_HYPDA|nr:hypothetical protein [Hyphomicrobium denitrificans]ADJ24815.1 hypothetical protein Hden_3020 [Hyphomicrobium denitrificans ATCC 51888]
MITATDAIQDATDDVLAQARPAWLSKIREIDADPHTALALLALNFGGMLADLALDLGIANQVVPTAIGDLVTRGWEKQYPAEDWK